MGKKQHQKDKMYLTTKEWSTLYGGKKAAQRESNEYRRLPYNYCGLSLQPAEHPYCTEEGVLYDLTQIVPFLKKFKHCPITGEPLNAKSLVKVIFHRNADGNIHCPIMYKEFTEHSHVIILKNTGLFAISMCVQSKSSFLSNRKRQKILMKLVQCLHMLATKTAIGQNTGGKRKRF